MLEAQFRQSWLIGGSLEDQRVPRCAGRACLDVCAHRRVFEGRGVPLGKDRACGPQEDQERDGDHDVTKEEHAADPCTTVLSIATEPA